MTSFTYADLAITMDLVVLGHRDRLEICRKKIGRDAYPQATLERMAAEQPKLEAIAKLIHRAAERDAKNDTGGQG